MPKTASLNRVTSVPKRPRVTLLWSPLVWVWDRARYSVDAVRLPHFAGSPQLQYVQSCFALKPVFLFRRFVLRYRQHSNRRSPSVRHHAMAPVVLREQLAPHRLRQCRGRSTVSVVQRDSQRAVRIRLVVPMGSVAARRVARLHKRARMAPVLLLALRVKLLAERPAALRVKSAVEEQLAVLRTECA